MRRVILFIILMLGGSNAFSQQKLIFQPSTWNFGQIQEADGVVSYLFEGKNISNKPVILLNVVTTCGCTVPKFSKKPILPGEKTTIKVAFDPKGRGGVFSKELGVYSVQREKLATLTVRGDVVPRPKSLEEAFPIDTECGLRLSGTLCSFGYLYRGVPFRSSIRCVNTSSKPLRLSLLKEEGGQTIQVSAPEYLAAGEQGIIHFSSSIANTSPHYGTQTAAWEVVVNEKKTGVLLVGHGIAVDAPRDFAGKPQPRMLLSENIVKFGSVKRNDKVLKQVCTLKNEGEGTLFLRKVEHHPAIGVSLKEGQQVEKGEEIRFTIEFHPQKADEELFSHRVILITNDLQRPMRNIRVTAIVEEDE